MYKRKVTQSDKTNRKFKPKLVGIDSFIHIGKYKYLTIRQILDRDVQYIAWCINKELIIPSQEIKNILKDTKIIKK